LANQNNNSRFKWVILFICLLFISWCTLKPEQKPFIIEGKIVSKDISGGFHDDSYITIKTEANELIKLRFETHHIDISVRIGCGENFMGRGKELDAAIALNDRIKVETLEDNGLVRDVYRLISIYRNE
jgi:hypothetical protein